MAKELEQKNEPAEMEPRIILLLHTNVLHGVWHCMSDFWGNTKISE